VGISQCRRLRSDQRLWWLQLTTGQDTRRGKVDTFWLQQVANPSFRGIFVLEVKVASISNLPLTKLCRGGDLRHECRVLPDRAGCIVLTQISTTETCPVQDLSAPPCRAWTAQSGKSGTIMHQSGDIAPACSSRTRWSTVTFYLGMYWTENETLCDGGQEY